MSVLWTKHPGDADLALFAGGELGPVARWRIERHVETCPHCEEAVADFFHLQEDLQQLAGTPAMDWDLFGAQIQAAVAASRIPGQPLADQRQSLPWTRAGVVLAAAACVVAVVNFPDPWLGAPLAEQAGESAMVAEAELPVRNQADARDLDTAAQTASGARFAQRAPTAQAAGSAAESSAVREKQELEAEPVALALLKDERGSVGQIRREPAERPLMEMRQGFRVGQPPAAEMPADVATAEAPRAQSAQMRSLAAPARMAASAQSRPAAPTPPTPASIGAADALAPIETGFSPLPGDVGTGAVDMAADGWMSVRSFDPGTGTVTIVDVYR